MAISITATPSTLIEEEGTLVTLTLTSDEPIPEGGLEVTVSSEAVNALGQFDVLAAQPENLSILGVNDDTSGFRIRLNEQTGTITLPVFDDSDADSPQELTFRVEPGEDYTVDESTSSVTLTIEDAETEGEDTEDTEGGMEGESPQATQAPEPSSGDASSSTPTSPSEDGVPLVSLNTGPEFLVEEEGTVSAHVFNVTGGTIPEGGLVVSVSAPNLNEFDLDAIAVGDGGEIIEVSEDGFDIRLTDFTTLVNLPVAADGEAEGLETANFTLEAGDGYEVNEAFGSGEFTLADTASEIPDNFSEPNDIIPLADDIGLSPNNPEVVIDGSLEFNIGNRYQNEDGSFTYVDASEDVDFYKVELKAGDIVTFDTDAVVEDNPPIPEAVFDFDNNPITVSRLFDADGNELAVNVTGQGPGELFIGGADDYIEFEAPEDGTYYLGVSDFPTATTQRLSVPELYDRFPYDPFVPASGNGESYVDFLNLGDYELKVTLNPENLVLLADRLNRSNNTPPKTIDVAAPGEPTVSLNFTTATYASSDDPRVVSGELNEDDILNGSLIEGSPFTGSVLNLVLTTEGEIPEEGILVTVNSNGYLRDYFSNRSFETPPFSPGSELVDVVTDETGRATGFQLRIFEPVTFFPLNARTPYWGELVEPGDDGLEFQPETDGPEEVTFFLEGGEGYGVSETASQVTPTFYDSVEQDPEPTVIPEVSLTISETELIESEGTETTLNFSLSEAPPEEGVLVYVKGAEGVLPQFDVLNAEVSGGVFPTGNFDFSGYYFKITEPEASINLPVFEDPFDEGLQSFSLALQETPLYAIDSDASEVNFTIADTPDSVLEVGLNSLSSVAVESDDTAGILAFNLTANPPESGVEVTVDADNLSEFDAEAFTVTGGEITEITDTGFSLNITDVTATVELPPLSDDEAEGLLTATFSLVESSDYLIDADAPEATVNLVDVPEQVPVTAELGSNDSISEALDINLNPLNPSAKITADLASQEPLEDYSETVEPTEDIDFYSLNLEAGDTVKLDIDTVPFEVPAYEGIEQQLDSELRLFDADGNELASVNNGAAPDEVFSRDPYLEFTAESAGTYYVGVSQLGNNDYDPLVDDNLSNGSGWFFPEIGVFYGEYELNVELASDGGGSEPSFEPVFGSLDGVIIEVTGSNQLIFAGDFDDLIDASIASEGGNRIYAGSGDDTAILGTGDRILGNEGSDRFFTTSGGDNTITGGAGADQFWIASAEIPDAANTITDFTSGEDVLGIAGLAIAFEELSITQTEGDALISANDSDLAILQGLDAASLSAEDFTLT